MGDALDFALANMFGLVSTFYKREEYLITFKCENNRIQINYFMVRKDLCSYKICKVMPSEYLTTQHVIIVLDVSLKN